jgi:sugar phosphate isomerase/epimerase
MEVERAIQLINSLVYKPGWAFLASDHTNRFANTVKVRIEFDARNSNRECAPDYAEEIRTYANYAFNVAAADKFDIARQMLNCLIDIETHEAREFLRFRDSLDAPFHPHNLDGMRRWGNVQGDLQFGIA